VKVVVHHMLFSPQGPHVSNIYQVEHMTLIEFELQIQEF
jgi:hypothetical protein